MVLLKFVLFYAVNDGIGCAHLSLAHAVLVSIVVVSVFIAYQNILLPFLLLLFFHIACEKHKHIQNDI